MAALCLLAGTAAAADFRVNIATDVGDADPADGRCDVDTVQPGDQCSLRAAAEQIQALPADEHRVLVDALPAGVRVRVDQGTIRLSPGTTLLGNPARLVTLVAAMPARADLFRIDGQGEVSLRGFDIRLSGDGGAALGIDQSGQVADLADLRIVPGSTDAPALRIQAGRVDCQRCRLVDGASTAIEISGGELRLLDSLVADNRSDEPGGGLRIDAGRVWLQRSEVSRNRSEADGGGIRQRGGKLRLVNSLLRGNLAAGGGGGLAISDGTAELQNSSVVGNVANAGARSRDGGGGVLSSGNGLVQLRNSIVTSNRALAAASGDECLGDGIVTEAANLIGDDDFCSPHSVEEDAPLRSSIPLVSALRELPWGGVRFLELPTGLHPAIDAGVAHCLADLDLDDRTDDQPLQVDLRGLPRPPPDADSSCDLGAIEQVCDGACDGGAIANSHADAAMTATAPPPPQTPKRASTDARAIQP